MPKRQETTITKRTVDALSVEGRDAVFWDRDLPGFGIRVYPSGLKKYVVQSRGPGGSRRVTLGRHGETSAEQARRGAFHHASVADPQPRLRDLKREPIIGHLLGRITPSRAVRIDRIKRGVDVVGPVGRTRCLPRRSRSARWPTSRNSTCAITCLRTARRRARRSRAPGTAPAHLSAFHHASVADPQPRLRDLKSESRSSATSSVTAGSTPSRAVRTSRLTPGSLVYRVDRITVVRINA